MMFMALHELSHNLGFKYIPYNKYFASYVANLPIAIPAAASCKRYHLDHHRYQGVDTVDVDIPTVFEGTFIQNYTVCKLFFVIFQLCFYAIRPMFVNPKKITSGEIYNAIAVVSYDIVLIALAGGSIRPIIYLLFSTLLGGGLHYYYYNSLHS
jgi:sphingolipid 4-desaturase/C4-monooxygenase